MLSVTDASAGYGLAPAFEEVSLTATPGEVVGVLGPNGAGKSSLLRTISGLLRLRTGTIHWAGEDISSCSAHEIARRGVAHVVEGRGILPNLSIRENILLGTFGRRSKANESERFDEIFEYFPWMSERLSNLGGRLSGGQQQMVAISRALMSQPQLLLLDEPSLGLAPLVIDELFGVIAKLATSDRAVVVVEQHIFRVLELADRAYVMRRGKLILSGDASELRSDERVEQAYFA